MRRMIDPKTITGGGGGGIEIRNTAPSDPTKIIGIQWYAAVNMADYWTGTGEIFTTMPSDDSPNSVSIPCGTGGGTFRKAIVSAYYKVDPATGGVSHYDENSLVFDDSDERKVYSPSGGTVTVSYKYVCNK